MIKYSTFTLGNGLKVAHCPDPHTSMAVVNLLYDTGSRDEDPALTGIAHLFEHLMFGGSANVDSFDNILEEAGGTSNASTSNDFTEFYDRLPVLNIETAFFLESDRMMALDLSEKALEVQQHVVIEEFKQTCLNRPYGRVMHELRPLLYGEHPYNWPVIGKTPEHIEKVRHDDAIKWHSMHYAPNNAVLSIVGDISLERTKELAEKWFGALPCSPRQNRNIVDTPWPVQITQKTIYDNVPQTGIFIAYRMDAYGTNGYICADAITDILSAGKSSRFYQRLMMGSDLFTFASASISGSEHSGMLIVVANVSREDDEAIDKAKEMLLEECRQLALPGNVTDYELERTKNRYESTFALENVSTLRRAQNIAMAVMHGEDLNDNVTRYRALTLNDIAATAQKIFIEHAPAIVVCRPHN